MSQAERLVLFGPRGQTDRLSALASKLSLNRLEDCKVDVSGDTVIPIGIVNPHNRASVGSLVKGQLYGLGSDLIVSCIHKGPTRPVRLTMGVKGLYARYGGIQGQDHI